ncbi:MAG: hypothetical protein ACREMW_14630 [Gemmatimonadales bacterium]
MKRLVLALALVAALGACKKAEQASDSQMADSMKMMSDSMGMMTDSMKMMADSMKMMDTTKH